MFDISQKFSVQLEGRGTLKVTPADHVDSGGEGHVYRPQGGKIALKIWDDPSRAISGRMVEKIKLLAQLTDPKVVAPQTLARDGRGNIVGYAMPWVSGWDLPLAFTNDWRAAHAFGDAEALAFAEQMRLTTKMVHDHQVIMGDANELNILGVSNEPRYIDVDPWLPPGFLGDKIMPTIRDWHAPLFTREADWFAWAIVTFQLLVGTHPYRGTHPDFRRSDLEARMKANASVFDDKVRLNAAVRPLAAIPGALRDWYEAAFQGGERSVPPEVRVAAARVRRAAVVTLASGRLKITEAFTLSAAFVRTVATDVILLADGTLSALPDGRRVGHGELDAVFIRQSNDATVAALVENGIVSFGVASLTGPSVFESANIACRSLWAAGNRLFAVVHDGIQELSFRDFGARRMLLAGNKWMLNSNATIFGDGAAVYDALGAKHLVVPQVGRAVAIVRTREIDGKKPVSIIGCGRTVIMSMIDQTGAYHRATFLLTEDLSGYSVTVAPSDDGSLSDVILDNGLILWIDAKGDLGMSAGGSFSLGGIAGGKLVAGPSGVFCADGDKMYRLSLGAA